ncbi:MAG: hypothetical protein JWM80_6409 [Cyanobacteria bacterium RYN_339]|nr:hypothetical protein [Cyanobacteria bacterium RYN_339]
MLPPVQPGLRPVTQAPAPKRPVMVEADVRLRMTGDASAIGNGAVKLDHGFMERLVTHLLRSPRRFKGIQVHFDAKTGTYAATGKVKLLGMWWPVVGRAKPLVDKNMVGFQFEELRVPLGRFSIAAKWITAKVTKVVADELQGDNINAQADPKRGLVRVDANSLLHNVGALPDFADLNTTRTQFGVKMNAQGDVTVQMTDPEAPKGQEPATPFSDITLTADDAALKAALGRALAPGFEMREVRVRKGAMTLQGEVEYKPLSDVATGLKALLIVIASRGRGTGDPTTIVKGPLDLDITVNGTQLIIKPSLKPARAQLLQTLKDGGIPAELKDDGIHADMTGYLTSRGIKVNGAKVDEKGLEARLQVDIDSRIRNPKLHPATATA